MKSCNHRRGTNRVFGPLGAITADIEDILTHVFQDESTGHFQPRADFGESETGYLLKLELPGMTIDQIDVEVQENRMLVSGEKKVQRDEDVEWRRSDRSGGTFKREIEFAKPVDWDQIEATLEQGVLTIRVPKSAQAMPRKVDIRVKS